MPVLMYPELRLDCEINYQSNMLDCIVISMILLHSSLSIVGINISLKLEINSNHINIEESIVSGAFYLSGSSSTHFSRNISGTLFRIISSLLK
jgi:hypothetical protein